MSVQGLSRTPEKLVTWKEPSASLDRKSTRLNSSHSQISYAVFCLKKKKKIIIYVFNTPLLVLLNNNYSICYNRRNSPNCFLVVTDDVPPHTYLLHCFCHIWIARV